MIKQHYVSFNLKIISKIVSVVEHRQVYCLLKDNWLPGGGEGILTWDLLGKYLKRLDWVSQKFTLI